MSVDTSTNKAQYALSTGTETLPIPFKFFANSDLLVIRTRDNVETTLTTGFSVSGAGSDDGGSMVLSGTQTQAGDRITIINNLPSTQPQEFIPNDPFPARSQEIALDRVTLIAQKAVEIASRSLGYSPGTVMTDALRLPSIPERALKVPGFDINGNLEMRNPVEGISTPDGLTVTSYSAARLIPSAVLTEGQMVNVSGRVTANDGGAGAFVVTDQDPGADNDGTILALSDDLWLVRQYSGAANARWFVGDPASVTNATPALQAAYAASKRLYIPRGTYTLGAPAGNNVFDVGDHPDTEIFGDGLATVLKLGDNVGRGKCVIGSSNSQEVEGLYVHDLACDLNGDNNLQTAFDNPLRLNSFAYLFSPNIRNVTIERVKITNASGSQIIRVSNDSSAVPDNTIIRDVHIYRSGLSISGNLLVDQSMVYVYGKTLVENCIFENPPFTMLPARGQTAVELHDGKGARIVGCKFINIQLPFLPIATSADLTDVEFVHNTMIDCMYFCTLAGPTDFALRRLLVADNSFFSSQEFNPALIWIGSSTDDADTVRSGIRIVRNHIEVSSAIQGRIGVFFNYSKYTDAWVTHNTFRNLMAPAVNMQGPVGVTGSSTIIVTDNVIDSCGSTAAGAPAFPDGGPSSQLFFSPANTNAFLSLVVDRNIFLNSANKDYSTVKEVYLGASTRARIIAVRGNVPSGDPENFVNDAGAVASVAKDISGNLE